MLGSKKKEEAFPVNEALLNVITPMGLEIKRNSLVIGENLGKVYGAVRYPQKVDMGWLSKITNIPSTIVSVGITPIDNGSLISAISKSIVQQRGAADSAKDPLTRQRAEKAAEDGEKIMQRIDQEGETVAMMSLTVMPIAQDEVNFTKVCRRVESAFNIQKCKVRTLANLQKEGFQSISPTYPANSTVDSIVSRIIPMSTFVGGFPFASSGYNDGRGYYFAKDSNGGLVILDTWERGNDRTNSSFVIMGVAGIGKSTVVKHIMLSEYMKGTKILCIDPESEYKDMCRNLNGSWLNAGGGKNGRSNLLQIRPAPRDDDDETDKLYTDEGNGMSDMALHMKTLEIEFSLYCATRALDEEWEERVVDIQNRKYAWKALEQLFTVGALTEVQKRRFRLHVFQGLSTRQIGRMEGTSHQAVAKSINLAIAKLKKYFAAQG